MRELHFTLVNGSDQNPSFTEIRYLTKELPEAGPSLVEDKSLWYKTYAESRLPNTDAEFNIFGMAIEPEPSGNLKHLPGDSHIEAPGLKQAYSLLSSPDPTRCKHR